mgnify:CR=1 FL=1
MNWNSHEFIWLDWTILAVGIVAVIWAVWRSVQKDKRSQQGASSEDYLFGKGGTSLVLLSLQPISVRNIW